MSFDREKMEQSWDYRDYMKAKHVIQGKYLSAWTNILKKNNRRLLYVDCFAGKGCYDSGEEGSPIIALNSVNEILKNAPENILLAIFIDSESDNIECLKENISQKEYPENIIIQYENVTYQDFIERNNEIIPDEYQDSPTVYFLDPFGYSIIPIKHLAWFMQEQKKEFIFTFHYWDLNRFLQATHARQDIISVFGSDEIIDLVKPDAKPEEREDIIMSFYLNQLKNKANTRYITEFCIKQQVKFKHRTKYYLLHGTNHSLGKKVMKNIMFNEGGEEYAYYEKRRLKQKTLNGFLGIEEDKIKKLLYEEFANRSYVSIGLIRRFFLTETKFVDKQITAKLKEMEENSEIKIEWPKNQKGRSYYKRGARVYFLQKGTNTS